MSRGKNTAGALEFYGELTVTGKVTLKSEAFGETNLTPERTSEVDLLPGDYAIIVGTKFEVDTMKGMPNPKWSKNDNIPNKSQQPSASDLKCKVEPGKTTHDFDLKP